MSGIDAPYDGRQVPALPTEALLYLEAGHLLYDTGYAPTTGYNAGLRKTGGTPQATSFGLASITVRSP